MRVRVQAVAAICMVVVALAGCGGSGDSSTPGRLEIGPSDSTTTDTTIAGGSLQQRTLTLRNGTGATARDLRVRVTLDANVLQLPLSCATTTSSVCRIGADGALEIDQLAAGESLVLSQQLRIKPGFSGSVSNTWSVSSASNAALSAQWSQTLKSRVADVSVALQSNTVTGDGPTRALSYVVTLSNAGPDEARDVVWTQTPGIDMPWIGATCSASGGAVCPAQLGEAIKIAHLPKGGSVSLVLNYGGRVGATTWLNTELLFSEVRAAGDPNAGNDRLLVRQADAPGRAGMDGVYDLLDYEAHAWRMTVNFQPDSYRELRFKNADREFLAGTPIDNTGFVSIAVGPGLPEHWYGDQMLQLYNMRGHSQSLIAGSFDFGHGLQPFLVAREWVTDLAELDGHNYTVMGSRMDSAGKAIDAFARAARFTGGALLLCESAAPLALDACPANQIRRYEAAVVGSELELMSSTEVLRMRAVRTSDGPVLVRSERAVGDGGAAFWVGMPQISNSSALDSSGGGLAPGTFASESGVASPVRFGYELDYQDSDHVRFRGAGGLPSSYLLYLSGVPSEVQPLSYLEGDARPTSVTGLYQGDIAGRVYLDPGPARYQGPIYFIRTSEVSILLGRKDGPLSGRWLITTD